jgi:hypothetical protein
MGGPEFKMPQQEKDAKASRGDDVRRLTRLSIQSARGLAHSMTLRDL